MYEALNSKYKQGTVTWKLMGICPYTNIFICVTCNVTELQHGKKYPVRFTVKPCKAATQFTWPLYL